MIAGVADTHAALWYLYNDARLSVAAGDFIDHALEDPGHAFKEAPFTVEIVDAMRLVPRAEVPDMPDRIVAATAVYFGVPIITRDGKIRASNVPTIW